MKRIESAAEDPALTSFGEMGCAIGHFPDAIRRMNPTIPVKGQARTAEKDGIQPCCERATP